MQIVMTTLAVCNSMLYMPMLSEGEHLIQVRLDGLLFIPVHRSWMLCS